MNRLVWRVTILCSVVATAASGSVLLWAPPSAAAAPPLPSMSHCKEKLHKSADNSHFDVWTCGSSATAVSDAKKALKLAAEHYSDETALMGGPPRRDSGTPAEGGDDKIDVYLVSVSQGQRVKRYNPATKKTATSDLGSGAVAETIAADQQGTTASGWMVLNVNRLNSPAFESDFVHEFFHLLQFRTNLGYCGTDEWWFTEASATWAESYFVPSTAPDEVYDRYTAGFEKDPSLSLTSMAKDDSGSRHGYSSFIWPYFMQQQAGPSSVADVWKQLKDVTSCADMNEVLNKALSFDDNFKDFAVRNLDSKLSDLSGGGSAWPKNFGPTYQDLDSNFPEAYPALAAPNTKNKALSVPKSLSKGAYPYKVSVPVKLPELSAQYNAFSFRSGAIADVDFDFSGLSSSADVTLVAADYGSHTGYLRIPVTGTSARVCLTIDENGAAQAGTWANGGRMWVIVDNHSLTKPLEGSYQLTARADCASLVTGALKDKTTTKSSGDGVTEVDKYADAVNVSLKDTRYGFDASDTTETSTYDRVDTSDTCTYKVSSKGSGPIPNATFLYAFNAPAAAHGPFFEDEGGVTEKGTYSGCGTSGTFTGESGEFLYCQTAGQSSYGNADESAMTFKCSTTISDSSGSTSWVGSGTLNATDADACGIWTTDCSVSSSAAIRWRAATREPVTG